MTPTNKLQRAAYVKDLFSRIAQRYDLMNRLMTGGMDISWRRRLVRNLHISPHARILDAGAGTGDLCREIRKRFPQVSLTAADFTPGMLQAGRNWPEVSLAAADAMELPFTEASFDAVVSGFLVRNVTDVDQTLREMRRVSKAGGRVLVLDMTRPRRNILSPLVNFYMNRVVPLIGSLVTGQKDAYTYLPDSTQNFLKAEDLADKMKNAGFHDVCFEVSNFGTVAIHSGTVPHDQP